ncbi:DUF6443 domain-containing protein, partial [Spongiimicrobium sp. 3-5]|uniref:DUF6443 domain-containing protein n=1 Tax=Spongiimicrobium sp. 3-5 TaxID=3332596 RepID=UPI00397F1C9F
MISKEYSLVMVLLYLWTGTLMAQEGASDKNYIHVTVPQKPVTITEIDRTGGPTDPAPERHIRSITYYDGLGRPMQELAIAASPESRDLVTHIGYDAHGRQDKQWLPYVEQGGINGSYRGDVRANTQNYYRQWYPEDFSGMSAQTVNPYSQTGYEASPLNRTVEQAAPGKDWQLGGGHGIETRYKTNTNGEVRLFEAYLSGEHNVTPTLNWAGHYRAGQLYKTVTYDENHTSGKDHSMEEFTDKQGRTVLKRTYNGQVPHDTYYVYDRYGNLSYVLPPKVDTSNGVLATELAELCYQYRYDDRNRLVEKKIPGKGWEYLVYNKGDRSVMTQDAIQRANNEWLFSKYDIFGRVAYTGMTGNFPGEREGVQRTGNRTSNQYETSSNVPITLAGTQVYYTNNAFPNRVEELHTINYYDNYNFDHAGIALPTGSVLGQLLATSAQGLSTGSKVRVLGTDKWITTITLYDRKGRPIYTATKNDYLNTLEVVETELNFTGKAKRTRTVHTKAGNAPITTDDRFTYDHVGRLLAHKQTINGGREETLVENGYDGLGQLQRKKVGGGLQTVDYAYNVRGWLKQINDPNSLGTDLFAFGINYNTADHGANRLYNGNIAETEWITANDNTNRWYRYGYDALNRISSATDNANRYKLGGMAYDKNGNILSLQRQGHTNASATLFGNMDALVYSYDNGNKLTKVLDNGNDSYGFKDGANTATEYTYDANGNMTSDLNKGIAAGGIEYNHLNLPT